MAGCEAQRWCFSSTYYEHRLLFFLFFSSSFFVTADTHNTANARTLSPVKKKKREVKRHPHMLVDTKLTFKCVVFFCIERFPLFFLFFFFFLCV